MIARESQGCLCGLLPTQRKRGKEGEIEGHDLILSPTPIITSFRSPYIQMVSTTCGDVVVGMESVQALAAKF